MCAGAAPDLEVDVDEGDARADGVVLAEVPSPLREAQAARRRLVASLGVAQEFLLAPIDGGLACADRRFVRRLLSEFALCVTVRQRALLPREKEEERKKEETKKRARSPNLCVWCWPRDTHPR